MTAPPAVRSDPAWYTPAGLPAELAELDRPVDGSLDVSAPGKVGLLELTLARHGETTRVEHQYQRAPLHVYRPIHLDERLPGMAFVFVQQSGDGFVQGDRCRIDIDCRPHTAVHVTTQAATNVYRAQRNFATQLVNLRVGRGAILEYLPDPIVPFRGSRFFQRTCLTADPDSTTMLGETLLPGRVARGERHVYDVYWAETEARTSDGTVLFADLLRLRPGEREPQSIGLLGGRDVVASLYLVTRKAAPNQLVELLREALAADDVLAGVSELPNDCGVCVRFLGATSKAVRTAVTHAWNAARVELLGAPAPVLRKG
jgi:urease accessory protein